MATKLHRLSARIAKLLVDRERQVVFAESCTGGLVAATLSQIPGISRHLCGSMVVYQEATKNVWLGIDESILVRPGPVSQVVAKMMAEKALENTPHADIGASVTGHLGPQAPTKLDGIVYIGLSQNDRSTAQIRTAVRRYHLNSASRQARQREAAFLVLTTVLHALESI